MTKVAPSLLAADYTRMGEEIRRMVAAGADLLHFDVMDGVFVPNISFGPGMAKACSGFGLPLDVHLMIVEPHKYLKAFAEAKPAYISVHLEASADVARDLAAIRELGAGAGLAISPDTPVEAVRPYLGQFDLLVIMSVYPGFGGQKYIDRCTGKVAEAAAMLREAGVTAEIEVDGGINAGTGAQAVRAGATLLVAGSALFRADDAGALCDELRAL
ncbi:MAG: ribulose-phosphate 3-epimerase [Clostridia bacterium]|nr:ribulose-phosphate 3-epimerase [Clostridia bacterium]